MLADVDDLIFDGDKVTGLKAKTPGDDLIVHAVTRRLTISLSSSPCFS
jgi:hypothetical protein